MSAKKLPAEIIKLMTSQKKSVSHAKKIALFADFTRKMLVEFVKIIRLL